jgi:hypothetical protein
MTHFSSTWLYVMLPSRGLLAANRSLLELLGSSSESYYLMQGNKERMEERKRRDFYICGGSHTHVFLICQECPRATTPHGTLPQENPLGWEPPLQHN